jgi:ubiquinone/menaquinone biosynthesis C-methylase UbiE
MSQPQPPKPAPPPQSTLHEVRTAQNSAAHLLPTLNSIKEANPNLKLLDVGSGSGTISISFAKLIPNGNVTGIDVNASIIPRARANAEKAGVTNIEFQEGSVFKLPFEDESFDVSFCHQVLVHIPNQWDALKEMLRVTKK